MDTVHAPPVDAGEQAPRPRRPSRSRRHRILRAAGITGLVLVLAAAGGAFALYQRLNGNIRTDSVEGALSSDRPPALGSGRHRPLNLLVIGSDSRAGANRSLGGGAGVSGERSDTTLLVHLAAGRRKAVVMSIPRDLVVSVPSCLTPRGDWAPERHRQVFNSAFEVGGAACARNTVERLTGIRIDHHIVLDFSGFKDMVDAVGGVEICVPRAIRDTTGRIFLDAGRRTVGGQEALDYVRLRHDESVGGTGSDLGRIKRQQAFVASLMKQMASTKVLYNPARLYQLADAATRSIRADEGLANVRDLLELARNLQDMGPGDITFVTVPVTPSPADRNRVEPLQPDARYVFEAINNDRPPVGPRPPAPLSPAAVAAPVRTPSAPTRPAAPTSGVPARPAAPRVSPPPSPSPSLPPTLRVEARDGEQDICRTD